MRESRKQRSRVKRPEKTLQVKTWGFPPGRFVYEKRGLFGQGWVWLPAN